jgi:hypothetical protein
MKKLILAMLMVVMLAVTCMAEITPDGIFSIEDTAWQALPMGLQILPFPWIWPFYDFKFGFDGGEVYRDSESIENSFYIDMLVFSIFWGEWKPPPGAVGAVPIRYSGILLPIGIGTVVESFLMSNPIPSIAIRIAILIKTDDSWTPPSE